ncbi:hypothetical protein BTN49_0242 [Candidatus Enterovibrio escicola]|uniref:Uncharacterized protein n=1 Tax=Candidatus Enterovibrio escicola TaxID=1927127 RepID=A0A2A5T760_9GAMM|nr:hypothetical protein BTN49_0242 [Candidatus Enterovibrio escacola]
MRIKQILEDRVLLTPSNAPVIQLSQYVIESLKDLGIHNAVNSRTA